MPKYIRNDKTISGRLHDEMVMMDIDKGKYFSLNPVATRIWELLDKPLDINEICQYLVEEYEVNSSQCHKETSDYLEKMVKSGLVLQISE
jgi:hypothetical protein